MFIAEREFERSLIGNAVYISGYDKGGYKWDNYALVKTVNEDTMTVVLDTADIEILKVDDFDAGLKMEVVWERKE
ncbi:hypothetical protein M5W68_18460 [Paenibacillus larvae]|uniref:hypothetical protein n=1 Tax=Paenibacillus larvae TaxID=1464 RepID=UPI00227FAD94|nr:hypothetical protein [Paenibacillus larvae]MCY9511897.1 hypothetical protein [Paenibacillus larvae]MCY9527035.1 hypothetical protein [Paenibacillus larvae]